MEIRIRTKMGILKFIRQETTKEEVSDVDQSKSEQWQEELRKKEAK